MKSMIFDFETIKKFTDEKPYKETLWEGDSSRINLMNLKPGQEIKPHVHKGDHIWVILEGSGEFLSSESDPRPVTTGNIIVAPEGQDHGVRNNTEKNLVFASITV